MAHIRHAEKGLISMPQVGDRVIVDYRAFLAEDGREFGSSYRDGKPLELVVGENKSVPGLEKTVLGMEEGETKTVELPAKQAYGEYDESLIEAIPDDQIPNADALPVGKYIGVTMGDTPVFMKVMKIEDGIVYLDFNHELAGKDIRLEVTLHEVKVENAIEREKHPAGCACGCDRLKEAIG